jgi:methylmalonyl-CoA mutase
MKWWDNFNVPTPLDRYQKIMKELKGKDMSEYLWSPVTDVSLNPFFGDQDNLGRHQIKYLKSSGEPWGIIEEVVVSDEVTANHQILVALQGGATGIALIIRKSSVIWKVLFDKVFLSFITVDITLEKPSPKLYQSLVFYHHSIGPKNKKYNGSINYQDRQNEKLLGYRHEALTIDINDDLVNGLLSLLEEIEGRIEKLDQPSKFFLELYTVVSLSDDYFLNIAAIKAVRSLIHLISKGNGYRDYRPIIMAKISENSQYDDPYANMVSMPFIVAAAALADVDQFIYKVKTASDRDQRIARNIHHILQQESYLDKVMDPLAGSYAIDILAYKLIETVWERFTGIEELVQ